MSRKSKCYKKPQILPLKVLQFRQKAAEQKAERKSNQQERLPRVR